MPKITDPFTPLFHELTEPMMRLHLNGTQFRILIWVARHSYGWNGAKFTPYSWGRIAQAIKADRVRVSREGRALLAKGILRPGPEGEIGIDKRRIVELGGCENARGECENAPCESDTPSVSKTHPLSYSKEKRNPDPIPLDSKAVKEASPPIPPPPSPFGPDALLGLWNARAKALGLPEAIRLTPDRRKQALARIKETPDQESWTQALNRVSESVFLQGQNERHWKAGFDWLLRPNTLPRLLEGYYGNGTKPKETNTLYD